MRGSRGILSFNTVENYRFDLNRVRVPVRTSNFLSLFLPDAYYFRCFIRVSGIQSYFMKNATSLLYTACMLLIVSYAQPSLDTSGKLIAQKRKCYQGINALLK
jgi:hypothetical protein